MILQIEPEMTYDGLCIWYYESGKKKQENTFIFSKKNGLEIQWGLGGSQYKDYFENDTIVDIKKLRVLERTLILKNKYIESFKIATKIRSIYKELYGEQSSSYMTSLKFDGLNYRFSFYKESISLVEELLSIPEKISGKKDTIYAEYLTSLASVHLFQNPQKSINLLIEAKSIFLQKVNMNSQNYINILTYLRTAYEEIGAYNDADKYEQELLRIVEENLSSLRFNKKKYIKEFLIFIAKLEYAKKNQKADISS
jgi:hypothetical protein